MNIEEVVVGTALSPELTALVNIVAPIALMLVGWVLKTLWGAVKDLQTSDREIIDKVNHIEVMVAGDYVKRDELTHMFDRLMAQLDKIDHKLDTKVDK